MIATLQSYQPGTTSTNGEQFIYNGGSIEKDFSRAIAEAEGVHKAFSRPSAVQERFLWLPSYTTAHESRGELLELDLLQQTQCYDPTTREQNGLISQPRTPLRESKSPTEQPVSFLFDLNSKSKAQMTKEVAS